MKTTRKPKSAKSAGASTVARTSEDEEFVARIRRWRDETGRPAEMWAVLRTYGDEICEPLTAGDPRKSLIEWLEAFQKRDWSVDARETTINMVIFSWAALRREQRAQQIIHRIFRAAFDDRTNVDAIAELEQTDFKLLRSLVAHGWLSASEATDAAIELANAEPLLKVSSAARKHALAAFSASGRRGRPKVGEQILSADSMWQEFRRALGVFISDDGLKSAKRRRKKKK